MIDAFNDYNSTVSIGGRTITNLCFAGDTDGLAAKEEKLAKWVNHLAKVPWDMEWKSMQKNKADDEWWPHHHNRYHCSWPETGECPPIQVPWGYHQWWGIKTRNLHKVCTTSNSTGKAEKPYGAIKPSSWSTKSNSCMHWYSASSCTHVSVDPHSIAPEEDSADGTKMLLQDPVHLFHWPQHKQTSLQDHQTAHQPLWRPPDDE